MTLLIDYAWQHPDPAAIKADGYSGVMRYLSNDPLKNLSVVEASALHNAGLNIGLVWETTATRAGEGADAGKADATAAEAMALELGYPAGCPIFYAVDFAATNPIVVDGYFGGVNSVAHHPVGVYGGFEVVQRVVSVTSAAVYAWQATAWSWDAATQRTRISQYANLFQRLKRTLAPIAGVADTAWDEDIQLAAFPLWAPGAGQVVHPPIGPGSGIPHLPPHKPVVPPSHPALPPLVVDGKFGPATVSRMQRALGVRVIDGKFGLVTAKALQAHLSVYVDGKVGPVTVRALQRRVRASVDGIWPSVVAPNTPNPNVVSDTTKHVQSALNGNRF